MTQRDESRWLAEKVDQLPVKLAEVLRLRLMGREFAEIALELGQTEEATRKRYLRGLNQLRGRLRGS